MEGMKQNSVLSERSERTESEWILDETYYHPKKVRFYCRECGYWQTARRSRADCVMDKLRFCPSCGDIMKREGRKKDRKDPSEGCVTCIHFVGCEGTVLGPCAEYTERVTPDKKERG